jgi:uncharacterized protein YjiS (DUF1127 family)
LIHEQLFSRNGGIMSAIVDHLPRAGGISWDHALRQCRRLFALIGDWQERNRQLRSLARLDDRLLADIGATREQQSRECAKTFWLSLGGDLLVSPALIQNRIVPSQIRRAAKS